MFPVVPVTARPTIHAAAVGFEVIVIQVSAPTVATPVPHVDVGLGEVLLFTTELEYLRVTLSGILALVQVPARVDGRYVVAGIRVVVECRRPPFLISCRFGADRRQKVSRLKEEGIATGHGKEVERAGDREGRKRSQSRGVLVDVSIVY